MTYRRLLVRRWDRRDRLGVLVVAVTIGFLTGLVLVVTATATEATQFASEYGVVATAVPVDDGAVQAGARIHLSRISRAASEGETYVAAVSNLSTVQLPGVVPRTPDSGIHGPQVETAIKRQLHGRNASVTTTIRPGPRNHLLPPFWYYGNESLITRLGRTATYTVHPGTATTAPRGGVPLRGVLAFFQHGMAQVQGLLTILAGGAAVLVAVTTFSLTRMTVRDRAHTLRVARATGATPRHLLATFALRGGLLTGVGVALGYAIGVIGVRAAVSAAVFLGVPTSLSPEIGGSTLPLLLSVYALTVGVGACSAVVAAWPSCRADPAAIGMDDTDPPRQHSMSWIRYPIGPQILDTRAVVPTAAALTVFVVLALLVASGAGTVGVLAGGSTTVTEQDAAHPIASTLPEAYADALDATGRPASGEILLFEVRNGQPFLARGADYGRFAAVSNATLTSGHPPRDADDAVIGADLARTLDVSVGDSIALGGSTHPAFTRVDIVGRYRAPGPADDQLVVPLATARHLSNSPAGTVQFVRTQGELPRVNDTGPVVVGIDVPRTVPTRTEFRIAVTLLNPGATDAEFSTVVRIGNHSRPVSATLTPQSRHVVAVPFTIDATGTYAVRVGNETDRVTVRPADTLRLHGPDSPVPNGSTPAFTVVTLAGTPVANATITMGDRTWSTDTNGTARLRFDEVGNHTLTVTKGARMRNRTLYVSATTQRQLATTLQIRPSRPTVLATPTATVTVHNPWNRTLTGEYTLLGPGTERDRTLTVAPRETERIQWELPRQPAGTYEVTLEREGEPVHTRTVRVEGDDRLAAALAASGEYSEDSSLGRALEVLVGNLQLVVGIVVTLAGLMTVASVTSTFAQAVHARRRRIGIHRATGAAPRALARTLVLDAVKIGTVAIAVAVVAAVALLAGLQESGLLTVYGIRLGNAVSARVGILIVGIAYGLVLVGVGLPTLQALRAAPSVLLDEPNGGAGR